MIQDFMAGFLFDCYQASTIEFETPRTDRIKGSFISLSIVLTSEKKIA